MLPADGDARIGSAGEGLKIGDAPWNILCSRLAVAFFKGLLLRNGQVFGESQYIYSFFKIALLIPLRLRSPELFI